MNYADKTALVTGANSGLGFEAAGQLAELGYGRVILACRTLDKAENAKTALAQRTGRDPFETLQVDVSSISSSEEASKEIIHRGVPIDALLLNAGMVSGDALNRSVDGLEIAFASSIIGHHVLTLRLLEAGFLSSGARVVIAGSESARDDLPAMFGFKLYDFIKGEPTAFGDNLRDAMTSFAKAEGNTPFDGLRHYSTTKVFTSWWSDALARRVGDRISVYTVSPGSNMGTNAARHATGIKKFLFTKVMPSIGTLTGMNQPVPIGAKRYIDVLTADDGAFENGKTYTSKEKKLTGPLCKMTYPHLLDVERQELAFGVLCELTGVDAA